VPIRKKNYDTLLRESLDHLRTNTDVTLLTPGSTARALVEAPDRHIADFHDMLEVNLAAVYLSTARGPYLDLLGEMFGLARRPPIVANIQESDSNIKFYVKTGTLYERLPHPTNLNMGLIPSGTQVMSTDTTITYTVDRDILFPRSAMHTWVSAIASLTGDGQNVGAFTLTTHNLAHSDVFVTNVTSVTTGRASESDGEFRSRIAATFLINERANKTAVRFAALSAPGVADVRVVPWIMGAGSFDVMLIPVGNRIAAASLIQSRRNIEKVVAFGMAFRVTEPSYVRFSMVVRITLDRQAIPSSRGDVQGNVERTILDYMGDLRMGDEMVVTELIERVRTADDRIYDMKIEAMCINGKLQLLHNFKLADDELFLPDEGLADPVRVI